VKGRGLAVAISAAALLPVLGLLLLVLPALIISIGLVIRQMRPLFRVMQTKLDGINGIISDDPATMLDLRRRVAGGKAPAN